MPFSNQARQLMFEHFAGKVQWPFNLLYVGLSTSLPDEDGNNSTEPSGANGYTRAATGPSTWGVYVPRRLINALPVPFPVIIVNPWGTLSVPIVAATFWRDPVDLSPASYMGFSVFGTPRTMLVGEAPTMTPGQLVIEDLYTP